MSVNFPVKFGEDRDDLTAPYNELEAFNSIRDALRWRHVRQRIPICLRKSLRNRYMLANLIYLGYTIALLVIDFHPAFNSETSTDTNSTTETSSETIPTHYEDAFITLDLFFITLVQTKIQTYGVVGNCTGFQNISLFF